MLVSNPWEDFQANLNFCACKLFISRFSFVLILSHHVLLPSLTNLRISVFVIYPVEDYFEM